MGFLDKVNNLKEKANRLNLDEVVEQRKSDRTGEAKKRIDAGRKTLAAVLEVTSADGIQAKVSELAGQSEAVGKITQVMAEAAPVLQQNVPAVKKVIEQLETASNQLNQLGADVSSAADKVEQAIDTLVATTNLPANILPKNLVADLVADATEDNTPETQPADEKETSASESEEPAATKNAPKKKKKKRDKKQAANDAVKTGTSAKRSLRDVARGSGFLEQFRSPTNIAALVKDPKSAVQSVVNTATPGIVPGSTSSSASASSSSGTGPAGPAGITDVVAFIKDPKSALDKVVSTATPGIATPGIVPGSSSSSSGGLADIVQLAKDPKAAVDKAVSTATGGDLLAIATDPRAALEKVVTTAAGGALKGSASSSSSSKSSDSGQIGDLLDVARDPKAAVEKVLSTVTPGGSPSLATPPIVPGRSSTTAAGGGGGGFGKVMGDLGALGGLGGGNGFAVGPVSFGRDGVTVAGDIGAGIEGSVTLGPDGVTLDASRDVGDGTTGTLGVTMGPSGTSVHGEISQETKLGTVTGGIEVGADGPSVYGGIENEHGHAEVSASRDGVTAEGSIGPVTGSIGPDGVETNIRELASGRTIRALAGNAFGRRRG